MNYNDLDQKTKDDCHIIRSCKEMHDYFVCCNILKIRPEEWGKRVDEIRKNKEYYERIKEYNVIFYKEQKEAVEKRKEMILKNIESGRKYSMLRLVLSGFSVQEAEKLGCR